MLVRENITQSPETYLVGKRAFNSFFVTVCRQGQQPERLEGFGSAEQARAWVKERVQAKMAGAHEEREETNQS